jgi:hypothetical protein
LVVADGVSFDEGEILCVSDEKKWRSDTVIRNINAVIGENMD